MKVKISQNSTPILTATYRQNRLFLTRGGALYGNISPARVHTFLCVFFYVFYIDSQRWKFELDFLGLQNYDILYIHNYENMYFIELNINAERGVSGEPL